MDVFNKVLSSVSNTVQTTVSQLSGLLGNPITKEYEVGEAIGSAGPGLCWKVYSGTKRSTKQSVSVFVFEKNQLKCSKEEREQILEILKRGVVQLTKIRHPRVLTVQHPLEESRDSIAFVTESVQGSLANILGTYGNVPAPQLEMHEIEIKYGMIQLLEGLQFLHNDMKLVHKNICPESIIVNSESAWKLFGFDFCVVEADASTASPYIPNMRNKQLQPWLEYSAPEWIIDGKAVCGSDIYSLGILIYTIHSSNKKPVKQFNSNLDSFKSFAADLKLGKYPSLNCVPNGIVDSVRLMIHYNPDMRPSLYELPKIAYFDDFGVKTLSYLESLYQWDNLQKSKFFKGLPQILEKFPPRINRKQILPCLVKEFVNSAMIPFVLPNVLLIVKSATKDEYVKDIQKHLLPIMKIEQPIQILLIFLQNIELLIKMSTTPVIKNDILSLMNRALECDMKEIQELCLLALPVIATHIDFATLKNGIFPRMKRLCINSQHVSVKVNCLISLGKLLEYFDKWFVLDEIIPFITQIPSKDPAVVMAVMGIMRLIMTHKKLGITKEVMATKIIPFLVPMSIENGLTIGQFNAIMMMIKEIIATIETEHRARLEQLNSVRQDSKMPDSASFPEFNLASFESSCLNKDATGNSSTSHTNQVSQKNEIIFPSSMSMPTIAPPPTAQASVKPKSDPKTPISIPPPTIASPPSFPSQMHQQQQQLANLQLQQANRMPTLQPNFSTLSQFQAQQPPSMPMAYQMQSPTQSISNQFQSTMYSSPSATNILGNSYSMGNSLNNVANSNAKSVTLSAQEINDFLSK